MALALDATSTKNTGASPAASPSWTHTCTGGNLVLYIGVGWSTASRSVSSVTYNGVTLTQVGSTATSGNANAAIYRLFGPSGGANTAQVNFSGGTTSAWMWGISFKAANQSPDDANNTGTGSASPLSTAVTTIADNDYVIDMGAFLSNVSVTVDASQTEILNLNNSSNATRGVGSYHTGLVTPPASTTMQWTFSGSHTWAQAVAAIKATSFPLTLPATTTSFTTSVTSMAVNLSSASSGDLLLAWVSVRNSGTWTPPSGWTQLFSPVASGGVGDLTAFYKISDGTEGSSATWTASTGTTAVWQCRTITNWHGTTPPEAATANSGGTPGTNPNPPSLTPSWGADNTVWLAIGGGAAEAVTITSFPTGYDSGTWTLFSGGGSSAYIGSAFKDTNAASEDPGTYTTAASRWWYAATIAIRPPAAAAFIAKKGVSILQAVNRASTY